MNNRYLLLAYFVAFAFIPLIVGSWGADFARKVVPDECVQNTAFLAKCNFGGGN